MAALASQSSQAANVSGYRALVCLFMAGGNDSHNWVVPIDASGYAEYSAARRELAWPIANLLPIATTGQAAGRRFGMPTELAPLREWYNAGRAAIVANVGPLTRPITKAEYLAGTDVPSKLFSHNDQQSTWQSLAPEGARSGWGGRMGDILMSANQHPVFTAVSAAGNAVFLSGSSVTQYQMGLNGPVRAKALGNSWVHGSSHRRQRAASHLGLCGRQPAAGRVHARDAARDRGRRDPADRAHGDQRAGHPCQRDRLRAAPPRSIRTAWPSSCAWWRR